MAPRLRITVDRSVCDGNAMCVLIAPHTFDIDERHKATVTDPEGDVPERVLEAAANCPVRAISVADAGSGAQLYP